MSETSPVVAPLLDRSVEMVRAYGSPDASRFASKVRLSSDGSPACFSYEIPETTLGERLEAVRDLLRRTDDDSAFLDAAEALPNCAEKHYLMAIAHLRLEGSHAVGEESRRELELALTLDPGNPVYMSLATMVDLEYADQEEKAQRLRDKSARLVRKLGRKAGIGR